MDVRRVNYPTVQEVDRCHFRSMYGRSFVTSTAICVCQTSGDFVSHGVYPAGGDKVHRCLNGLCSHLRVESTQAANEKGKQAEYQNNNRHNMRPKKKQVIKSRDVMLAPANTIGVCAATRTAAIVETFVLVLESLAITCTLLHCR